MKVNIRTILNLMNLSSILSTIRQQTKTTYHNNTDEENAPIIINEREPPEDLASTSRDGTVWRNEPPSINSLFT